MPLLHDSQFRSELQARLRALQPASKPQWGKMSVDQMLWHVNQGLALSLGQISAAPGKTPLPKPIMRFLVVNLPWPKSAPTLPVLKAEETYDFEKERTRCLRLLDAFVRKDLYEPWPNDPIFGKVDGRFKSRLQAKHIDHHLKQFGV